MDICSVFDPAAFSQFGDLGMLAAIDFSSLLNRALSILYVALGLGGVIFFHELGHFAVAKWCDVHVERFSIGFGPVIWSMQRGETEYALSLIPFGGYVKMLGQDDADPSQLTNEEIAEDPRSYSAKSVPQRMAIISAGVIMNIATGLLFFATAFGLGVQAPSTVVGSTMIGSPAWTAGVRAGDRIVSVNGQPVQSFQDMLRIITLSHGKLDVEVGRGDEIFTVTVMPEKAGNSRRVIGVGPALSLTLIGEDQPPLEPLVPGGAAREADPGFEPKDKILSIGGTGIGTFAELQRVLAERSDEELTFTVESHTEDESEGAQREVTVAPMPFRTLGLRFDIGQIEAMRDDSPGAKAGFEIGDKIAKIIEPDGTELQIPSDLDPLRLSDYFSDHAGEALTVLVRRKPTEGEPVEKTITVTPEDRPAWSEPPASPKAPLSIPSLGIACSMIKAVNAIDEDSPVGDDVEPLDIVQSIKLTLPEDADPDGFPESEIVISLTDDEASLPHAFWRIQQHSTRDVTLIVKRDDKDIEVEIEPIAADDWFLPFRGIRMQPATVTLEANTFGDAFSMAAYHTRTNIEQIYMTIRSLVTGGLSIFELRGPIGITTVAYKVAQQGIADLLMFLGFLSINLAVLNFLPIPVLDGGHMVFLLWEAVTGRKPSENVMIIASYIGLLFILGLMGLVIYLDLFYHELP